MSRPPIARRPAAPRRVLAMTGLAALMSMGLAEAGARWTLVIDPQRERCLEGVVALWIDKADRTPDRDAILAFHPPAEAAAYFPAGMLFAKRVKGMPGDRVVVTRSAVTVNGAVVAEGLALAAMIGAPPERFETAFEVPPGHVFLLGDAATSFDGRYWGTLPLDRVVGRARRAL